MIIKIIKDIRFWIIVFFVIRLFGITNAPLEVSHNWRQTTVTMVARNFLEIDNNILYPRIDIAGEKTGITGMEFPLLNYIIYIVSEIFGYQHWYGRLVNLIVSSFGLLFFYKLIKKYFHLKVAFYSTLILTVSIWFSFSRKIMPDTFSVSLIISSLYFGSNYLEIIKEKRALNNLLIYSILLVLGSLSKIPSAYLIVIFGIFYLNKKILLKRKIIFFLITILSLLPTLIWYFFWVPHLVETYDFWHFFMGGSFAEGFKEISHNLPQTLKRFYDTSLKFAGFFVFIFGLTYAIVNKAKLVLSIFIISFTTFCIIIFKAGFTFPHHSYYIIPFAPIMAFVAGYGLSKIKYSRIAVVLMILIAIEGVLNQQHDFRIKDKEMFLINLDAELDKISNKDDLFIINSGEYPTPMYFSHRKGWINSNDEIKNVEHLKNLKDKGLKYILILKNSFGTNLKLELPIVLDNTNYCVYKL